MTYKPSPVPSNPKYLQEFLSRELQRISQELSSPWPFGSYSLNTASSTSIAVAGTYYKAAGTTTAGSTMNNMNMSADNRLLCTFHERRHYHVATSITMSSASGGQVVGMALAKNGTVDMATAARRKTGNANDLGAAAIHGDFELGDGDYLEVFITNETGTNAVQLDELYVFAVGMPMYS